MKHSQHGEDGYSKLQSLFEDADALRDTISELIGEARGGNQAAIDTLEKLCGAAGTSLVGSQWFTVSTGQSSSVNCAMPNNPHALALFRCICTNNPSHAFCKRHKLTRCPIVGCGGTLR
jgi:hypothetical protein